MQDKKSDITFIKDFNKSLSKEEIVSKIPLYYLMGNDIIDLYNNSKNESRVILENIEEAIKTQDNKTEIYSNYQKHLKSLLEELFKLEGKDIKVECENKLEEYKKKFNGYENKLKVHFTNLNLLYSVSSNNTSKTSLLVNSYPFTLDTIEQLGLIKKDSFFDQYINQKNTLTYIQAIKEFIEKPENKAFKTFLNNHALISNVTASKSTYIQYHGYEFEKSLSYYFEIVKQIKNKN